MKQAIQFLGSVLSTEGPEITHDEFSFQRASVKLNGKEWVTLSSCATRHHPHSFLAAQSNVPWLRGRLQTLFQFEQSQEVLGTETWVDGRTCADRVMLNASFVAKTKRLETPIQIPFVCVSHFIEAGLGHGELPERNVEQNQKLLSAMTHSFVSLLLKDDTVEDYNDYHILLGKRYSFGVRNGTPYHDLSTTR